MLGGFLRRGRWHTWGTSERVESADQVRDQLINEGFEQVRAFHFDADTFDFALLEDELVKAATAAYSRLKQQGINAFALFTDDGAMTIGVAANVFASIDDAAEDELRNPSEWSLDDSGRELDIAYRLILSRSRDELSRVEFSTFREGLFAAMENALKRIDFGDTVVLSAVTDAGVSKLISPESLRERFDAATEH